MLDAHLTDVVPLVRSVLDAAGASTGRHALSLVAPDSAEAMVDPLRLEQVLTNLVDNAVKYSPDGGPVQVEVFLETDSLRIEVTDHGIGIPPEHRERVFDRFHQAHGGWRLGGMGLGLYISRQIVELHAGELTAEQPAEGGTRMVVRVPRSGPFP